MDPMQFSSLLDPLSIDVLTQWTSLPSHVRNSLPQEPKSQEEVLRVLSQLLHNPRYTLLIAQKFRFILLILCAQWLDHEGEEEDKLAALALLVNPHEELFPILSAFLRKSFAESPMANISISSPNDQLHLRLLAYYRILSACPHISTSFGWSPEFLSCLISLPHHDAGVRYLAVRCHALCMHMTEVQREELQLAAVGPAGILDIPIEIGRNVNGEAIILDGWLLPATEVKRIEESRRAMLQGPYFHEYTGRSARIDIYRATDRVADVHGVLLLRNPPHLSVGSRLVTTTSTVRVLRELAIRVSLRLPTLLSSSSSGKTLMISHIASLLYPENPNHVVSLHLSDRSLDARSLLGSYVSSTTHPGSFEWQEGVIVRAMKHGLWLVFKDIDKASPEVLGTLLPLVESLGGLKHIGASASLDVPGHGKIDALESFMVFATRSLTLPASGEFSSPTFLGANKFSRIDVECPTDEDLVTIIHSLCPQLGVCGTRALVAAWRAVCNLGYAPGMKENDVRGLVAWCRRVESLLLGIPKSDMKEDEELDAALSHIYPQLALREEMFLEARDIFFGAGTSSESSRTNISEVARTFAEHLGLSPERAQWVLEGRIPKLHLVKDGNGRISVLQIGRTSLPAVPTTFDLLAAPKRPFAMHHLALLLMERIATCVSFSEPVLLVGETGTGKTALVSHIASLLNRKLVTVNLSHHTESSDLIGGFKPVDSRIPGNELQRTFTDIFSRTFSRKKNGTFEEAVRKAVNDGKWRRAVGLWKESTRLALIKIRERSEDMPKEASSYNSGMPRKKRKISGDLRGIQESEWLTFAEEIERFDIQHVKGSGKFAFSFVEGPLIEALRYGHWVLLDEINLASHETLESISSILQGPTASVILSEQGSFSPVPRHPDFKLFACMNPATDVGKRNLSPTIRSRFTEIFVPPADSDRSILLPIIEQYIGHCAVADKRAMLDIAEFYMEVKALADNRELADGSNHKPHFSMRTLTRALTFASDTVGTFGLRKALWEGCLMAFSMALDQKSTVLVGRSAEKRLLANVKNVGSMMSQVPLQPGSGEAEKYERVGTFWLERGSLPLDDASEYVLTPSVQAKLVDLARAVLTRRFPILIEGPTSSGKTSAVEYLARRTGHRFVRVNNHEHTDVQEYIGTYVPDPDTGKLVFRDGILVRALRNGDWIVLDELNLAPTDVMEALNRLLDDNRELIIPETQEVVRPHPHFVLFATQNPPGLYAGRKVLSRAFRNRFIEVHFDDVPQSELQTILSQRCRIPDSYAQRIVSVFQELSRRRQAGRVFETKHGFATLRDLFRWASRDAVNTHQLAENGYMLLAERARRPDDRAVVKEVIEAVMKERIDVDTLYDVTTSEADVTAQLGIPLSPSSKIVWTSALKRLYVLVTNALRFNEPVLLVGPTGSGKTSVCQLYAIAASKQLISLNCHQNTETADIIGGQRPLRNRHSVQSQLIEQARVEIRAHDDVSSLADQTHDVEGMLQILAKTLKIPSLSPLAEMSLKKLQRSLQQSTSLFEWHDGPLIHAMRTGDVFLLDEISLADDSVLERLNSVLEPTRSVVLAERGGLNLEHAQIVAEPSFKLLATMNPGGDYGKKELSPALRNRFTEIWVPQLETRLDRRLIIDGSWRHDTLRSYTDHILDFTEWLSVAIAEPSIVSVRDLLTWVDFSNKIGNLSIQMPPDILFHHAAHLVFLDGLESSSYTSGWSVDSLHDIRERGLARLEQLVPLYERQNQPFDGSYRRTPDMVFFGAFGIHRGPYEQTTVNFSLQAPTSLDNMRRLVRACQVSKPILLEGSPGVGKTSLVSALAEVSGHRLCRINLSDQTDLIDLFGSDYPVEGGGPSDFAWKDAAFLSAMQNGDWVLLDEMNLAPQAILEGLNAVLDHRGTVFIPELGRSFTKHQEFRIFAAQNPLHQGGGRKGLPKSFLDRFIKVYIAPLSSEDYLVICQSLFPSLPTDYLRSMILFNARLLEETMEKKSFGREGAPWEFNLRDIIRWATLLTCPISVSGASHPSYHLDTIYLQRFRTEMDRIRVIKLFCEVFTLSKAVMPSPWASITPRFIQFGPALLARNDFGTFINPVELQRHLRALASISECLNRNWLAIITGSSGTGKTQMLRYLAAAAGRYLREFSINNGIDTSDLLGGFEQVPENIPGDACFQWMDGPLVQAMKNGHWLVLDNANLCNPSVLDRLNSLCEANGSLVLTERGHFQGEMVILRPHPNFRLLFTFDPRNGELSRAMRNRGVEIHLPAGVISSQDALRIQNSIRAPPLSAVCTKGDDLAIWFEFLRRGHVIPPRRDSSLDIGAVRGGLLCSDSTSSAVLDQTTFNNVRASDDLQVDAYAHTLFSLRSTPPSRIHLLRRLLVTLDTRGKKPLLLNKLTQTSIPKLRSKLEISIAETRNVPLPFISDQPYDLSVVPGSLGQDMLDGDVAIQQRVLSRAIELFVNLHFSERHKMTPTMPEQSLFYQPLIIGSGNNTSTTSSPAVAIIFSLYSSIMELSYDFLDILHRYDGDEQLPLLEDLEQLIDVAQHLQLTCSNGNFDFTSAKTMCLCIRDTISRNRTLGQSSISNHVESLENVLSLTSGHGMQEIWGGLVAQQSPQSTVVAIAHLDKLAAQLDPRQPSFYQLRVDIFNAMALSTFGSTQPGRGHQSVVAICRNLEQRLTSNAVMRLETAPMYTTQLAVAELGFLSTVLNGAIHTNDLRGESLVLLTLKTPYASLARITQVKHLLWTHDVLHGDDTTDQLSILASLFQRWLSAVNDFGSSVSEPPHGPEILFEPIIFQNIGAICRHDNVLGDFDFHENSLHLESQSIAHRCRDKVNDRMLQILNVWIGVLLLIAKCFKETYSRGAMQAMQNAASHHRISLASSEFVKLVSRTTHPQLSQIVQDRLLPASRGLEICKTEPEKVVFSGKAWIAMGLALLELYVPSIPLDPAAAQRSIVGLWRSKEAKILAQLDIHVAAEKASTGNDENPLISALRDRLHIIRTKLHNLTDALTSRDPDIKNLHAFHGELSQFLARIVWSEKFNVVVRDLEEGGEEADVRAMAMRKTIAAFVMRMETTYSQFNDIIEPVSMAMSQLIFGLHSLIHAWRCHTANLQYVEQFRTLISFPTVSILGSLKRTPFQNVHSTTQLLLRLMATAYDIQARSIAVFRDIDDLNDRLLDLWQADRDEKEKEAHESQSLYRFKNLDHYAAIDDKYEEEEFRDLFPIYESERMESSSYSPRSASRKNITTGRRVSDNDIDRVYRIHLWIMECPNSRWPNGFYNEFQDLRKSRIFDALDAHSSWLPQCVDSESLPYQVFLLSDAIRELKEDRSTKNAAYNFYRDSNIREARKAVSTVQSIQGRLRQLIEEWPEQMILRHIMTRCEAVMNLDIHSPVAKILAALEQLILQTEDWEIYANRENSLKPQQLALSELIVEWRRLELSYWSQLLEAQALAFSSGTAEWWFRLYELIIRGTTMANAEGTTSVLSYFSRMISLLEEYISAGPLGQYKTRMRLLGSFADYAERLSTIKSGSDSGALARAGRILRNLYNFFDQFSGQIARYLADRRAIFEKDLSNLIKLASWKDANVHALRQSAQGTHKQLYKCIRTFRELLREPVAPLLSHEVMEAVVHEAVEPNLKAPFLKEIAPITFPVWDQVPSQSPELSRTFSEFRDLLASHSEPLLSAVSFDVIEGLAGQIADSVTTLSRETNDAGSNARLHKTLNIRKRKAWVDLLKELKRAGLSSKLKPEVHEQQRNQVWLMDRSSLKVPTGGALFDVVSKGDKYFNRLLISMPKLRDSLVSHHGDLPTRELERATTFVESCFSLALSSRTRLTADFLAYQDMKRIADRLKQLSISQAIPFTVQDILSWLEFCRRLEDALWEISNGCHELSTLEPENGLSIVSKAISEHALVIRNSYQSLSVVYDNVRLPPEGLITNGEHGAFHKACSNILSTKEALKSWAIREAGIRHLCEPVLSWLEDAIPEINKEHAEETNNGTSLLSNTVNRFLVISRGIFHHNIPPVSLDGKQPMDRYAFESEKLSGEISRLFALEATHHSLLPFVEELKVTSVDRIDKIRTVAPFVDMYLILANHYLLAQARLSKAFLKLSYVLCNVVHSVSSRGFCKPQETEDLEAPGDKDEAYEGTGIGQGSGANNISDQIDDENQVEGLRGEDTRQGQEAGDCPKEEAVQVKGDIDGETGGMDGDGDDDGSDQCNEPGGQDELGEGDGKSLLQTGQVDVDQEVEQTPDPAVSSKEDDPATSPAGGENELAEGDGKSALQSGQMDVDQEVGQTPDAVTSSGEEDPATSPVGSENELTESDGKPSLHSGHVDVDPEVEQTSDAVASSREEDSATSPAGSENELAEGDGKSSFQSDRMDVDQEVEQAPDPVASSEADISTRGDFKGSDVNQGNGLGIDSFARDIPSGIDAIGEDLTSTDFPGAGQRPPSGIPNPLLNFSDTLRELRRNLDKNYDPNSSEIHSVPGIDEPARGVDYVQEGTEEEHDMQALGPTKRGEVAKSGGPKIRDLDDVLVDAQYSAMLEPALASDGPEFSSERNDRSSLHQVNGNVSVTVADAEFGGPSEPPAIESVEEVVNNWQETGRADSRAAEMWRLYDSLTQELSHSLCEQLRLILEPTYASRLRGDFRTGKRLNMKKVIPYIASEYTKDKIWMRRTRPSQREYQVLIALDDSRSMAESHSIHLAHETLALVSKALNRLESGEVAIVQFGESVEVVHDFAEGMVGDREGEKMMRSFKFAQRKTDMLGLIQESMKILRQAREQRVVGRSSTEAVDLWQLEIIISDGICQDHDELRTVLRKAEEQRILVVFIIVDSLHTNRPSPSSDMVDSQNTILSMSQVSYKDMGEGRMEIQMQRYLDSFPFQYYVVLRSVDALPDVLSGTLKQFFERISEE